MRLTLKKGIGRCLTLRKSLSVAILFLSQARPRSLICLELIILRHGRHLLIAISVIRLLHTSS